MTSLWLVVPVHGRPGITRLCLEQKVHLAAELADVGISMRVVVVGDDENIGHARELGHHVIVRPNVPLGRKINDGFEYACREGGANYVSFVGSDDWMLPSFMADLPEPHRIRSAGHQAFVSPGGRRLIVRRTPYSMGGAPWVIPTTLLAECDFRPVWRDHKMNGMDGLIARSLAPKPLPAFNGTNLEHRLAAMKVKQKALWQYDKRPSDLLRMVDFKGTREQITKWSTVLPTHGGDKLLLDTDDVWSTLATRYPAELVERMEALYANGEA